MNLQCGTVYIPVKFCDASGKYNSCTSNVSNWFYCTWDTHVTAVHMSSGPDSQNRIISDQLAIHNELQKTYILWVLKL